MIASIGVLLTLGPILIQPSVSTQQVEGDPDDIAVWVDRTDPSKSVVIGTDKKNALYGFDLQGRILWTFRDIVHPNNVDIRQGVSIGDRKVDIAVATERERHRLRIFEIRDGGIRDISGHTATFEGEPGAAAECMGIGLYKSRRTGETYAFVSRKKSLANGYVWQYKLVPGANGTIDLVKVREIGHHVPTEVEAIVADDELGFVYFAEEEIGIHKHYAEPSRPSQRLALLGTSGYSGEREGLALVAKSGSGGYLASCDQIPGGSIYNFYPRSGSQTLPQWKVLHRFLGISDSTDGIEIVSEPMPGFPNGMLIAMNSQGKNFHYYQLPVSLTGLVRP